MAILLAATGAFLHERLASNLDGAVDRSLRSRAVDVAALAQQSDSGLREARGSGGRPPQAQVAQLIDAGGRVLDRTPGLSSRPLITGSVLASARGHAIMTEITLGSDERVRLLAEPARAQDQKLIVVVGQSLEDRARALSNLTDVMLLGGPAALLLASIAGYFLTGAALRPVEAMRRRAADISATNLEQRLSLTTGNDELARLGRTLNEMLSRIHASVAHERTFLSDASHELRSPLAMLRTELELIARDRPAGAELQTAIRSAIDETDRLSRLANDLLLLSGADEDKLEVRPSILAASELLRRAADRARRGPSHADVEIEVRAHADIKMLVDADRLDRALDNLLANALRYARTRIVVTARTHGPLVELHVIDDGPGFPEQFLPHAWERFSRPDAGRTEEGAGVGLAIVQTIAKLHGGSARATNRPDGGADVWIAVPRAPATSGAPPMATPARAS